MFGMRIRHVQGGFQEPNEFDLVFGRVHSTILSHLVGIACAGQRFVASGCRSYSGYRSTGCDAEQSPNGLSTSTDLGEPSVSACGSLMQSHALYRAVRRRSTDLCNVGFVLKLGYPPFDTEQDAMTVARDGYAVRRLQLLASASRPCGHCGCPVRPGITRTQRGTVRPPTEQDFRDFPRLRRSAWSVSTLRSAPRLATNRLLDRA